MREKCTYKIYCDESCQIGHKYFLLGGMWIREDYGWTFYNDFEEYCRYELNFSKPLGHMKWTKVPSKACGKYYEAYKKLVDLYFDYNERGIMKFRTIITDTSLYDFEHSVYYGGDYEAGFYNLYCYLLLSWIDISCKYKIRIASRNVKKITENDCEKLRLLQLKNKIDYKLHKKLTNNFIKDYAYNSPIINIESRAAKERRLIQITDILLGAVAYYWNKHFMQENCREGKTYLAAYISSKMGREDLCYMSNWNETNGINIFYFDTEKSVYKSDS